MSYHPRPTSPPRGPRDDCRDRGRDRDREHEPYHAHDRSYRPTVPQERDRDSSYRPHHRRSRSRSRSPRIPHDAPRGPRGHRSRSQGPSASYYDRDAPRSRSRSRGSPTERFVSRDVIIEGFGGDMQEDDIIKELVDGLGLGGVEKLTLIRDRKTGASRGFAFAHFSTTRDSTNFVDRFGPTVRIGEDRCRIAFSKERDEGERRGRRREDEGEEWRCRVCLLVNFPRRMECFRCSTPKSDVTLTGSLTHPTPTHFTNDGERDMAVSPPSQFLLLRHLEATVNEEMLAKGVLKLTAPIASEGASEGSVKRVLLVRDRRSNESWRFGFAEFASSQEAQKALNLYEKIDKFTISSKPVELSYIHPGVFVPVYNAPQEAENFTFLPLSVGGGLRLAYWDEEGYVSEFVLKTPESSKENKQGKEAKAVDAEKQKGKKRKAEAAPAGVSADKSGKKAALPAHLQFWQNRHSELHGLPKQKNAETLDDGNGSTTGLTEDDNPQSDAARSLESFADLKRMACLLCVRQFKTPEKLHEHERVSTLHASNLQNEDLKESARKKLTKITNASSPASAANQPEYRDRAKERRQTFGPSIAPEKKKTGKVKTKTPEKSPEPEQTNKGAALLGKMGWTKGQGLGATGEGRTNHVVAEMYTAGVGLGMKGAKVGDVEEVAKGSGGYEDFVRKTRDRAKERYESMD